MNTEQQTTQNTHTDIHKTTQIYTRQRRKQVENITIPVSKPCVK
jgi:hypothetical protein